MSSNTALPPVLDILRQATPHPDYEWSLENGIAYEAFGLKDHRKLSQVKDRHPQELLEGQHWYRHERRIYWTKRGLIRAAMFIETDRAQEVRDEAERLVFESVENRSSAEPLSTPVLATSPAIESPAVLAQLGRVLGDHAFSQYAAQQVQGHAMQRVQERSAALPQQLETPEDVQALQGALNFEEVIDTVGKSLASYLGLETITGLPESLGRAVALEPQSNIPTQMVEA